MARAEDPAQLREETPLGEEASPARVPAQDRPADAAPAEDACVEDVSADSVSPEDVSPEDAPADTAREGAGESRTPVSVSGGSGSIFTVPGLSGDGVVVPALAGVDVYHHLGLSYGQPYQNQAQGSLAWCDGYFKPESGDSSWGYGDWGYEVGLSIDGSRAIARGDNGYFYFFLPDMGRVPDLEVEGLYLYGGAENTDPDMPYASWAAEDSELRGWRYDESHPGDYIKLELETVSEGVDAIAGALELVRPTNAGSSTLVRFPAKQVDDAYSADRRFAFYSPASEDIPFEQWSIPIVARWVPSQNSGMTLFALDVTDSAAGATETVTDLYTQPFRQAGEGDHLQAGPYSVTYLTQLAEGSETTRTATAFTPPTTGGEAQHYYLRVREEQDSVTLRFLTQEPYYTYHITENGSGVSPVAVTAAFAGESGTEPLQFEGAKPEWWDGEGQPFLPLSLTTGTVRVPQNSTALPARGQWTAASIPLKKVSEAANAEKDPFNTITVTITSPDGAAESVYVFHIERLMTPETALGSGNSPVGMIARDNSALWNTQVEWGARAADLDPGEDLTAYNKASAVNYFQYNYTFQGMPILPTGTANQSGAIYKGTYLPAAWSGVSNPDLDPAAVVAYQDMAFDDPGVSFVDSEGRKVVFGDGATGDYKTCVTRTLELKTADALSAASYGAEGTKCWYTVDETGKPCLTTDRNKAAQTLRRADGSDGVDLRGLIVLPGVYTAVYTFTDPVSDDELTAERTVVVLPVPGDVDMDGAVTAADAAALAANAATWDAAQGSVYRLLRNRVYGMNTGDNSAMLNAETIRQGFQPILGDTEALGYSDYLYLPLPYTDGDGGYHARKTWDQVTDLNGGSGPKLRLDFLGVEQGTWIKTDSETYTNNISGPWNSPATSGDNPGVSIVSGSPNTGTGDVFWMGVYVEDPGAMKGGTIQDLSISLVYDSEYVRPAVVHAAGAAATCTDDLNCWQVTTLLQYNFLTGSLKNGQAQTIFSGMTGGNYAYTNSVMDRSYATHYSKVKGDLELEYTDAFGRLSSGKLKEVVFSLQGKSGTLATMKEGYLLVLPFQLIRHPDARMANDGEARLIELSAGMRDFSVVLASSQTSANVFSLLDAELLAATTENTYAFSAQDDIYGNTTRNIRASLTYDSAGGLVPIGVDNTVRTDLKVDGEDPVYDEALKIVDNAFFGNAVTAGSLPPGLELDSRAGTISGTPTRAGVYDFSISGVTYRITVKPKTIHYQAKAVTTYYGESEFRGASADRDPGQRSFTFTYDRADLAQRDQEAAQGLFSDWTATGQGSAEELEAILTREGEEGITYIPPTFQARDGMTPVAVKTDVGKYDIIPENQPATDNYDLVYDTVDAGKLTIEARPVWVSHLVIPQDRSGARIYNDQGGARQSLVAEEQEGEVLIFLAFDETNGNLQSDGNGGYTYYDTPLTGDPRVAGDTLTLKYQGDYLQNAEDLDYVEKQGSQAIYRFLMQGNEESRDIQVTALLGNGFTNTSNYALQLNGLLHPENCQVSGTVVRRGVEAIRFTKYPYLLSSDGGAPVVPAYYGDTINDEALYVEVTRGAGDGSTGSITVEYVYNNPMLQPMELHYNWVSPEEMAEGLKPENRDTLVGTGWDPTLPEGEQDLRPYNGTDILTPDMDGYYLCAAVKKYEADLGEGESVHYIKTYSTYPIQVKKRTITLTAQSVTRYYGEENGTLCYTYDRTGLIQEEQSALYQWVREKTGDSDATPALDGAEMEAFFREVLGDESFQAPTLTVSKRRAIPVTAEDRVDKTTPVGGGEFYIILQGGASTNYDFAYVRPVVVDNVVSSTQTETVRGEGAFGFSKLTMLKRPIVVRDVYSPKGTKEDFETIYADTKNLFLQNQTAGLERVDFTLPRSENEATYFYRSGGSGSLISMALTYADPDGPAVVNGDDVNVRYSLRFMCDQGHYLWLGFDNNYYDVESLSAAGGTLQKDVVVADLELLGDAAINYELVYNTSEQAMQRAPSNVTPANYPDPTHSGFTTRYLIHGTGAVTLRRVSSLELRRLSQAEGMECVGQVSYTYGDNYAPYVDHPVSGAPLTLVVNYETEVDERHDNGDYARNVHNEVLVYTVSNRVSNFSQRGLVIYYLKPGQSTEEAIQAGQTLDYTTPMIPDEHDGARIFITGARRAEDPLVVSKVSDSTLQVAKGALTFTVRDAHRFYGESLHINDGEEVTDDYLGTTAFTYTFPTAQLALRDREELARLKGVAVTALPSVSTEADLKLLQDSGWPVGLLEPAYTPDPGPGAAVNGESWGEYPIDITPKNLRNYTVTGAPGTLYVYPRPVRVTDVYTSAEDPVYTIYNQSSTSQFVTQLDTQKVELTRNNLTYVSAVGQMVDARVSTRYCSDDILRAMPLSGEALVGEDSLIFTVLLWFYPEGNSTWDLEAGTADYAKDQVRITFREVKTTETAKNYAVTNVSLATASTFERDGFWGAVKLRTIDEIFITGKPRTEYAYGDTLDLSGLQVTIRYKALQGAGEVNVVNYLGPDSFKAVGLYVNYWYPEDTVPGGRKPNANADGEKGAGTTTELEDIQRKALPNAYRRADWGDHLTIAPTHDTQQYVGQTSSDPLQRPFAANGKYLIISAFQEGEKQTAATPKILGEAVTNTSVGTSYEREDAPTPIVVTPMQLRYDLRAADKTYDGTTQAAGTLTLKNVFDATVQVKIEETDGWIAAASDRVRDVVYVPMGAAYEDHGADQAAAGYNAYRSALENGVVSFTTGTYQPNGEAPLMENGRVDWAEGYTWGKGLTFTFPNPNVHYLEAGESQPRAIGTQAMADYWRASQSANDGKGRWDTYGEVCAMPVEVTGMTLAGPDAANYTWAADGAAQGETAVTITTRSGTENGQAPAPYATIHKANRAAIQSMAGQDLALPYLQVDEHTNVVRLFYDQDLDALADNNNAGASADEFRDELHFEYALYYEDEDGLMAQWAGATGSRAYQDTTFFGGELVRPQIDPAYVPDYDHLPLLEDAKEDFVRKGQRYQWAGEDTGVSELGCREDAGIVRALDAYPGGAENAETYYTWYYDLYTWGAEGLARTVLPRDTVFYPLVRLSETHNYNASGALSGDEAVTAQALDAAQKAVAKLAAGAEEDETLTTDARSASADVFSAAAPMREAALALSERRVADDAAMAEEGKFPEEGRPLIGAAPAVKTFLQRLDLLSASRERGSADGDDGEYLVQILEDVWFTDTLYYPETANMDAVVYNSPTRYYSYYWDVDCSAQVRFGDDAMPIDFGTVMTVEIRQRQSDGSTADLLYTYDPEATGHTAQLYVQTAPSGSRPVRSIRIVPEVVYARLGDEPYPLSVVTVPAMPSPRRYTWTTSDPSVVTVSQYGVLTFRGEGSAVITVTTSNGRVGTATVIVSAALPGVKTDGGLFNFNYPGPWALLDGDYAFRPKVGMTRGELVTLLDLFLTPSDQWQATQELAYIDVTGREKYYEALKRLTGAGVVTGIPGGTFAGDQLATRAEFVTMLSRMLQLDIVDTQGMTHAFADTDEAHTWAYAYIDALAKTGAIRGVGEGDFAPNRVITREETAAIIARLLTTKLDLSRTDLLRPSDMTPENWSYPAVLRAINTVAFPD